LQLPLQLVSFPPFSQVTLHGAPPPEQSTAQVEPSQVTSQPPPAHAMLQLELVSQSNAHVPPVQA